MKTALQQNKQYCLNCGHSFAEHDIFCSQCGQKNRDSKIKFRDFINEVFKGFTSWDTKFWTTLFPLLSKPGKVSKDYIEGKRARYTNPFRFYLTTSILFFLLAGIGQKVDDYKQFASGNKQTEKELSIINFNYNEEESDKKSNDLKVGLTNDSKFSKFYNFYSENKELSTANALDSLKLRRTFGNRFLYLQAKKSYEFQENPAARNKELIATMRKQTPKALFIFLPLFALFLALIYFKKEFTYVEHLIFVFHTQTVCFFLLMLSTFFNMLFSIKDIGFLIAIFVFFIYFFIAMKKFYGQNNWTTFTKFILAISSYIGLTIVSVFLLILFSIAMV